MNSCSITGDGDRPLTDGETRLAKYLLENGKPTAKQYLSQLEYAQVTSWRCPCGCASINFKINGRDRQASGPLNSLSDFLFGEGENLYGIFIYESDGILRGLEVYGLSGNAPNYLPMSESLRSFDELQSYPR